MSMLVQNSGSYSSSGGLSAADDELQYQAARAALDEEHFPDTDDELVGRYPSYEGNTDSTNRPAIDRRIFPLWQPCLDEDFPDTDDDLGYPSYRASSQGRPNVVRTRPVEGNGGWNDVPGQSAPTGAARQGTEIDRVHRHYATEIDRMGVNRPAVASNGRAPARMSVVPGWPPGPEHFVPNTRQESITWLRMIAVNMNGGHHHREQLSDGSSFYDEDVDIYGFEDDSDSSSMQSDRSNSSVDDGMIGECQEYVCSAACEDICTICMDSYDSGQRVSSFPICMHAFHRECLSKWLRRRPKCPNCRRHI